MDQVSEGAGTVTFRDVDEREGMWRRIPLKGGRGIVVIANCERLTVTDHCMAVCCRAMATWLMDLRWGLEDARTVDHVSTHWEGKAATIAKHIGGVHRKDKDVAEVRVVMRALESWRRRDMTRTSNMIALPPYDTQTPLSETKFKSLPLTIWRQMIDESVKRADFRVKQPTHTLLPMKHLDRWALVIWDGEINKREVLTLGELEFSMGHWKMMETLDSEINKCYK
jgi:hypothetical protein